MAGLLCANAVADPNPGWAHLSPKINYVLIYLLVFPAAKWSMKNVCGVPTHYCLFRGKYTSHRVFSLLQPGNLRCIHRRTFTFILILWHFSLVSSANTIFFHYTTFHSFFAFCVCVGLGAGCTSIRDKEEILCASRHYCWQWLLWLQHYSFRWFEVCARARTQTTANHGRFVLH